VDDDLMIRFAHHDKVLMNFLGMEIKAIDYNKPMGVASYKTAS